MKAWLLGCMDCSGACVHGLICPVLHLGLSAAMLAVALPDLRHHCLHLLVGS